MVAMDEIFNVSLEDIGEVAKAISMNKEHKVFLFYGEMGAGKTTLISEICKTFKVEDNVASPTFSLVNEYLSNQGPIYHFDFYRISSIEEALDAGVEEYFYSGNICLIEWPELIDPIIPMDAFRIDIENRESGKRNYKLSKHEPN